MFALRPGVRTVGRKEIVEEALNVLATSGARGLSLAHMALAFGVDPPAIRYHFKSEEDLLASVLDLVRDRLCSQFEVVCKKTRDPIERLHLLLLSEARLMEQTWAIPVVIFSQQTNAYSPERRAQVHGALRGYLSKVGQLIRMGQAENMIRSDVETEKLAMLWLGLVHPASILGHFGFADLNLVEHAHGAWQIFHDAIRNRRP